ncbi:MAG TPA: hypothetical protein VLD66_08445 [Methyloceanibacter sp.]|nr:hypothetical protein [Methyloceanibacter sp.]
MRKLSTLFLLMALSVSMAGVVKAGDQTDFKLCQSTYALCTTAPCTPIEGTKDTVACACAVETGYSAGLEACQDPTDTAEGKQIRSRYFPVKSYAVCSNDRPWAWCLDKPCIIDKDDPSKATCTCTSVSRQGLYVIVTDAYTPTTCTTGIISSATVTQITQVTDFLKGSGELKPFDIKVLNSGQ